MIAVPMGEYPELPLPVIVALREMLWQWVADTAVSVFETIT